MATSSLVNDPVESNNPDDWFDIDKYRQAAGVAYEFSKKKLEDQAGEQRRTAAQQQEFAEKDEARDYRQAREGYKF
jgi:hypothetical protein